MARTPPALTALAVAFALASGMAQGVNSMEQGGTPDPRILTESWLSYHPDIKHRMEGLVALEDQLPEAAFAAFQKASRFADKASQAMVAEMLWNGQGSAVDRPLAYAWMDLAAERGYTAFVGKREKFWSELSADERKRAIQVGEAVYAEFGDAVAKQRIEDSLKRGRSKVTGSRAGFVGNVTVIVAGPGGLPIRIQGDTYYDDKYWRADDYFEWQDQIWSAPPTGTVSIGEIASATEAGDKTETPKQ